MLLIYGVHILQQMVGGVAATTQVKLVGTINSMLVVAIAILKMAEMDMASVDKMLLKKMAQT